MLPKSNSIYVRSLFSLFLLMIRANGFVIPAVVSEHSQTTDASYEYIFSTIETAKTAFSNEIKVKSEIGNAMTQLCEPILSSLNSFKEIMMLESATAEGIDFSTDDTTSATLFFCMLSKVAVVNDPFPVKQSKKTTPESSEENDQLIPIVGSTISKMVQNLNIRRNIDLINFDNDMIADIQKEISRLSKEVRQGSQYQNVSRDLSPLEKELSDTSPNAFFKIPLARSTKREARQNNDGGFFLFKAGNPFSNDEDPTAPE